MHKFIKMARIGGGGGNFGNVARLSPLVGRCVPTPPHNWESRHLDDGRVAQSCCCTLAVVLALCASFLPSPSLAVGTATLDTLPRNDLPAGYKQLAYVAATGSEISYIDTKIVPHFTNRIDAVVQFESIDSATAWVMGSRVSTSEKAFTACLYYDSPSGSHRLRFDRGTYGNGSAYLTDAVATGTDYEIRARWETMYATISNLTDGASFYNGKIMPEGSPSPSTLSLYLYGLHKPTEHSSMNGRMRTYWMKMRWDKTLTSEERLDLVPAQRLSDGAVGLYNFCGDDASGTLFLRGGADNDIDLDAGEEMCVFGENATLQADTNLENVVVGAGVSLGLAGNALVASRSVVVRAGASIGGGTAGDLVVGEGLLIKSGASVSVRNFTSRTASAKFASDTSMDVGTLEVSGMFRPETAYFRGLGMLDGSTLDLRAWPAGAGWPVYSHFTRGATNLTFAANAVVNVNLAGRTDLKTLAKSASPYLLTWSSEPTSVEFALDASTRAAGYRLRRDASGLRLEYGKGLMLIVR